MKVLLLTCANLAYFPEWIIVILRFICVLFNKYYFYRQISYNNWKFVLFQLSIQYYEYIIRREMLVLIINWTK